MGTDVATAIGVSPDGSNVLVTGYSNSGVTYCSVVAGLIELHANDLAEPNAAVQYMRRELLRLARTALKEAGHKQDETAICHIIIGRSTRRAMDRFPWGCGNPALFEWTLALGTRMH